MLEETPPDAVFGDHKTVLRGGYQISYQELYTQTISLDLATATPNAAGGKHGLASAGGLTAATNEVWKDDSIIATARGNTQTVTKANASVNLKSSDTTTSVVTQNVSKTGTSMR